jgi:hypothetical protein
MRGPKRASAASGTCFAGAPAIALCRYADAEPSFKRALAIRVRSVPPDRPGGRLFACGGGVAGRQHHAVGIELRHLARLGAYHRINPHGIKAQDVVIRVHKRRFRDVHEESGQSLIPERSRQSGECCSARIAAVQIRELRVSGAAHR